jgi:hypothetical protein
MPSTYSHETWSTILTNPDGTTSGIPISHMDLTSEEKDVINLAFSSTSPFINPISGDITVSINSIDILNTALALRNTDTQDDLFGLCNTLISNLTSLKDKLHSSSSNNQNFLNHTNRLSGTSGGKTFLQNDGSLYGFAGVQGIASAYNSVREAMKDEGSPTEDNYSIFFTSILVVGKSIMADVVDLVNLGVLLNGVTLDEFSVSGIASAEAKASSMTTAIDLSIDADNDQLSYAVDYLKKFGHGNMVLGMNKDTYFGKRLLDDLQSDVLADELDDIE